MSVDIPPIGIAVLMKNDKDLFLGRRLDLHGKGTWETPDGHLVLAKTFKESTRCQMLAKMGRFLADLRLFDFTKDYFYQKQSFVFLCMEAHSSYVLNPEPHKDDVSPWFSWHPLLTSLFSSLKLFTQGALHKAFSSGQNLCQSAS